PRQSVGGTEQLDAGDWPELEATRGTERGYARFVGIVAHHECVDRAGLGCKPDIGRRQFSTLPLVEMFRGAIHTASGRGFLSRGTLAVYLPWPCPVNPFRI